MAISNRVLMAGSASGQRERGMWDITPRPFRAIYSFLNFAIARFARVQACVRYPTPGFLHRLHISSARFCCISEIERDLNQVAAFLWSVVCRVVRGRGYAGAIPARFSRFAPVGSHPSITISDFDQGRLERPFRTFDTCVMSPLGAGLLCVSARTRRNNTDSADPVSFFVWARLNSRNEGMRYS